MAPFGIDFVFCVIFCIVKSTNVRSDLYVTRNSAASVLTQRLGHSAGHMTNRHYYFDPSKPSTVDEKSSDDCHRVVNEMGQILSNYSLCIARESLRSKICVKCLTPYLDACKIVRTNFTEFMDEYGQKCKDRLIVTEGDWLMISAKKFFDFWDGLHCAECYVHDVNANCSDTTFKDDVIVFFKTLDLFYECASNATHGEFREPFVLRNETINTTACTDCSALYQNLTAVYSTINRNFKDTMCQDVADAMNYTRWLWSVEFQCHLVKADILTLMLVSSFLAVIPITFYIASYLNGSDVTSKLLPQKRLRSTATSES